MKNVSNTYIELISLSVFNTGIIVLCAPDKEELFANITKLYGKVGFTKKIAAEDVQKLKSICGDDLLNTPGQTVQADDGSDVFMLFQTDDPSNVALEYIVHETHHAAYMVCDHLGIEDEECEAYLQEYIFKCIVESFNNINNKN